MFTLDFVVYGLLSAFLLMLTIKQAKGTLLNIYYSAFYLFQLVVLNILLFQSPNRELGDMLLLRYTLDPFAFGVFVACLGIFVGQLVSSKIFKTKKVTEFDINNRINQISEKYPITGLSIFLALCFSTTILSSFNLGYVVNVTALSFSFAPTLIGFIWGKLNFKNKILWITVLLVNFVFHSMQGSRGTGMFPVFFLIIGYLISIKQNRALLRKRIVIFVMGFLAILPLMSFIAAFREAAGRGLEVSSQTFDMMLDYGDAYFNGYLSKEDKNPLGRFMIQANPAAITLTPERVPFRGTDGMADEFKSVFSLGGEDGTANYNARRGSLNYGTGVANHYGFHVNEYNSVEWPLFADSYTRFGHIGLFVYSVLFAIFLFYLEVVSLRLWEKRALLSFSLYLFILYNGFLSYMYPHYSFMKLLVFRMIFVAVVITVASKVLRKSRIL